MVGAAGCSLVKAGGVLGLSPCGLHYALTAWALPSQFALRICGSGFTLTKTKWIYLLQSNKWIHLFCTAKNLWIHIVRIQICRNSYISTIEFIEYMNSYIVWVHTFYYKRNKYLIWDLNHQPWYMPYITTSELPGRTGFSYSIYTMYHMNFMSEKITSQNKLYEIKLVPYNKPLL